MEFCYFKQHIVIHNNSMLFIFHPKTIYIYLIIPNLEPKRMLFINQDGITMKGEPLYQDEKDHKAALAQFF